MLLLLNELFSSLVKQKQYYFLLPDYYADLLIYDNLYTVLHKEI